MRQGLKEAEAEQAAEEVVAGTDLSPGFVCPFSIARSKGIEIMAKPPGAEGVSGFLIRVGNQFGIGYATHIQNEGFVRFTVAHELGHYFIPGHPQQLFGDRDGMHASKSGFLSTDPIERQADAFATALLMPEVLFLPAMRCAGEGFAAIEALAGKFKTSITSTALRYIRFVEDPVAVIMSHRGYIDWCFLSDPLKSHPSIRFLGKGSVLPPRSITASFTKTATNISGGLKAGAYTSLDDWFDDAPQVEMKEDVVGLGSYGRALTVLFTSDPLDEPEEEEDDE